MIPLSWFHFRQSLTERLAAFLDADEARAEASLWLEEGLGKSRGWIAAHGTEATPFAVRAQVAAWLKRRESGEPWQLILGWTRFRDRRFQVTRDTLIPRPETELVLEAALLLGKELGIRRAVDVGTGSGILAICLALETPWELQAVDVSPAALRVARDNAGELKAQVSFHEGHLLDPLPDAFFDDALVVANLPYVDPADAESLQRELAFEPPTALYAPDQGLALNRALIRDARQRGARGLVLEIGAGQGPHLLEAGLQGGWKRVQILQDWHGHDRVWIGQDA